MILSLGSTLQTVFAVFGAFWVAVVIGTYFGVGILTKRAERSAHRPGHGPGKAGHAPGTHHSQPARHD